MPSIEGIWKINITLPYFSWQVMLIFHLRGGKRWQRGDKEVVRGGKEVVRGGKEMVRGSKEVVRGDREVVIGVKEVVRGGNSGKIVACLFL